MTTILPILSALRSHIGVQEAAAASPAAAAAAAARARSLYLPVVDAHAQPARDQPRCRVTRVRVGGRAQVEELLMREMGEAVEDELGLGDIEDVVERRRGLRVGCRCQALEWQVQRVLRLDDVCGLAHDIAHELRDREEAIEASEDGASRVWIVEVVLLVRLAEELQLRGRIRGEVEMPGRRTVGPMQLSLDELRGPRRRRWLLLAAGRGRWARTRCLLLGPPPPPRLPHPRPRPRPPKPRPRPQPLPPLCMVSSRWRGASGERRLVVHHGPAPARAKTPQAAQTALNDMKGPPLTPAQSQKWEQGRGELMGKDAARCRCKNSAPTFPPPRPAGRIADTAAAAKYDERSADGHPRVGGPPRRRSAEVSRRGRPPTPFRLVRHRTFCPRERRNEKSAPKLAHGEQVVHPAALDLYGCAPISVPEQKMVDGKVFPLALGPSDASAATGDDLVDLVRHQRDAFLDLARKHHSVLFRGWGPCTAEHYAAVGAMLGQAKCDMACSAGPRVEIARHQPTDTVVFTANEAPPTEVIPFHHEMAQCDNPPAFVLFFCLVEPPQGGATPIVPSHPIATYLRQHHSAVASKLKGLGVRYVRVLPYETDPSSALGKSWRHSLRVANVEEAEAKLRGDGATWEWLDGKCAEGGEGGGVISSTAAAAPTRCRDGRTARVAWVRCCGR